MKGPAATYIVLDEQYPRPVVMHEEAREATRVRYGVVKKAAERHQRDCAVFFSCLSRRRDAQAGRFALAIR
jgi:hypothetical protein